MLRTMILALIVSAGCNGSSSTSTGTSGSSGGLLDKVKAAGDKVGGALDKLDTDEVKAKLASAKESIGTGLQAAEECAWALRVPAADAANAAIKAPLDELRRVCTFEAPLGMATVAVSKAESAKAEQPQAPSYTECSSDDWAKAKAQLDASPFASEQRWVDLKARWTKICAN